MIMLQVIAQLLNALALVCDVWVVDMPLRRSRTIAVSSDTSFRSSWISEDQGILSVVLLAWLVIVRRDSCNI